MRFIAALLLNGLLVYAAAWLLSGVYANSYIVAVFAGLFLAIANAFVRPVLILLTLPITVLTLGLFLLVVNGLMVLLVDYLLVGFRVDSLLWAVIFAIVLAVLNLLVDLPGRTLKT